MRAVSVLTTGGTIDKVYFDAKSAYAVGDSVVGDLLREARAEIPVRVRSLMRKDSLDMTDEDRATVARAVTEEADERIIITHGTDTMVETGQRILADKLAKVVVLTGALAPARFAESDAAFNLGMAFAAVQSLGPGVYLCMNGEVFDLARDDVRKDRDQNQFLRGAGTAG